MGVIVTPLSALVFHLNVTNMLFHATRRIFPNEMCTNVLPLFPSPTVSLWLLRVYHLFMSSLFPFSGVHRFRCILTLSGESQNCVVHIKNCTRRVRERAEQSWVALYFDRWTDIAARPEVVLGQTRYVLRRVTCDDDPVRHSVKW